MRLGGVYGKFRELIPVPHGFDSFSNISSSTIKIHTKATLLETGKLTVAPKNSQRSAWWGLVGPVHKQKGYDDLTRCIFQIIRRREHRL